MKNLIIIITSIVLFISYKNEKKLSWPMVKKILKKNFEK